MKKIVSSFLVFSLLLPSWAFAAANSSVMDCRPKISVSPDNEIVRVCNDVSDIICKDVKLEERRSCNESNEYIFSKETTANDVYHFAKGCFKSGVTSFTQFFTDFIPQLLKGIWDATKATADFAYKSATGEGPGLWSKIKGMYESSTSLTADLYEAVSENPAAYFEKIWSKVVDVVGPMVANYDCLKPQKKVENICGFIVGWIVPPALLAKILVRGIKEVKFLVKNGTTTLSERGKLLKALEHAEKRPVLTLKQLQEMESKFKKLGYTDDEFELLYSTGALAKLKLDELKPLTTAEGRAQKKALIGESKPTLKAATLPTVPPKPKAPVKPRLPDVKITSDFVTFTSVGAKGEKLSTSGQIIERVIEDGEEVAYRVRMINPVNGNIIETRFTREQIARLNPKSATPEAANKVTAAMKKDTRYMSPEDEFKAAQKEYQERVARETAPDNMAGATVTEMGMEDFKAAQEAVLKKEAVDKAAREAAYPKPKVEGIEVDEIRPGDARYEALMRQEKAHTYPDGIDYVPVESPGVIVRTEQRTPPPKTPRPQKEGATKGPYNSNYIQVMTKNSMGVTTFMPAEIVKQVVENGIPKYIVRILDKSTNTYKEKKLSLVELKGMKAKEAPKVQKEIQDFNRNTGFHQDVDGL